MNVRRFVVLVVYYWLSLMLRVIRVERNGGFAHSFSEKCW